MRIPSPAGEQGGDLEVLKRIPAAFQQVLSVIPCSVQRWNSLLAIVLIMAPVCSHQGQREPPSSVCPHPAKPLSENSPSLSGQTALSFAFLRPPPSSRQPSPDGSVGTSRVRFLQSSLASGRSLKGPPWRKGLRRSCQPLQSGRRAASRATRT